MAVGRNLLSILANSPISKLEKELRDICKKLLKPKRPLHILHLCIFPHDVQCGRVSAVDYSIAYSSELTVVYVCTDQTLRK